MSTETISIIFQSITLLAVFAALWQLILRSRKMHRDTEMVFVRRYWEIMDRKSPEFVIDGTPKPSDQLVILQYLLLCEDEIDHRHLGKIPRDTWMAWQAAIREQLADPHVAQVLEKSSPKFPSLRKMLGQPSNFDPHPKSRFVRWLRGE